MPDPDLGRLARDRRNPTPELHQPNDFYGYAHTLKRWTGRRSPLAAVVEHGVQLRDDIWAADRDAPLPTLLGCTPERSAAYEAETGAGHVGVAIGTPIAYAAPGTAPSLEAGPPTRAVVAFPAHSTHHIDTEFDTEDFLAGLEAIRSRHGDVQVCLYWRDVLLGAADAYRARGFSCVCAGHLYDERFLPRLYAILASAGAIVTNEVGSHLFYAVALGRPVWLLDQRVDYGGAGDTLGRDTVPGHRLTEQARNLFGPEERTRPDADQEEFVAEVAGSGYVRQPVELAQIFSDADRRYAQTATRGARATRSLRTRARRLLARTLPGSA